MPSTSFSCFEVGLVVEWPGQKTALVRVKAGKSVAEQKLRHLRSVMADHNDKFEAYCFCQGPAARKSGEVMVVLWEGESSNARLEPVTVSA